MQMLRRRASAARGEGSSAQPAPERPSGLRSWLFFPVIFDFVWQDTASPTVTYAVVLKLVKCVIVILTQASDYIKKSLKKSKAKGKGAAKAKAAVQDKALMLEKCVRSLNIWPASPGLTDLSCFLCALCTQVRTLRLEHRDHGFVHVQGEQEVALSGYTSGAHTVYIE
jgi:hypothetical protein